MLIIDILIDILQLLVAIVPFLMPFVKPMIKWLSSFEEEPDSGVNDTLHQLIAEEDERLGRKTPTPHPAPIPSRIGTGSSGAR